MSWIKNILQKNKKILALSPMADMTDSAFCQIVRQIGGADIVFREMVSAEALIRESVKTLGMTDFVSAERPIVQQIFGSDPLVMARAAAIVMEHANPEGLDINMGCPVYKITSNFNGCALMKDPERAWNIIREMRNAIEDRVPITVKIRLGWSDPDDFKKFIPVIEDAGASLITIHGRTKTQGYSGKCDWTRIAEAKKIARVPLLANGDIHEPEQVSEVLGITGADGVLIARGALGNPWFFKLCANIRKESEHTNYEKPLVTLEERVSIVLQHARLHVAQYGERGIVSFRKHLSWYFKASRMGFDPPLSSGIPFGTLTNPESRRAGIPGIKDVREKLVRVNAIGELEEILSGLLQTYKSPPLVGEGRVGLRVEAA